MAKPRKVDSPKKRRWKSPRMGARSWGPKGALGDFGPLKKVASLRAQGGLGAFGPLKKVASLRDPCPESPEIVGYTFYFISEKQKMGGEAVHLGLFRA